MSTTSGDPRSDLHRTNSGTVAPSLSSPPAGELTEAMVEAAARAVRNLLHAESGTWDELSPKKQARYLDCNRIALTAALRAAPRSSGTVTRELVAGLLSTLSFRPSSEHPEMCLPMADQILRLFSGSPSATEGKE